MQGENTVGFSCGKMKKRVYFIQYIERRYNAMGMLTGKHRNRHYLDDYQINELGEYEYHGLLYRWVEPEKRKEVLRSLWLCRTAAAVLMLAAGCIPAPGVNNMFYLLLPYAAGLGFCIWSAMALGRMGAEGNPMRGHVFKTSAGRLPIIFLFAAVMGIICVIAEVVHLILHTGDDKVFYGILFILMQAAAAVLLIAGRRKLGGLKWNCEDDQDENREKVPEEN